MVKSLYRLALTNDGAFRGRHKAIIKWSYGYPVSLTYISKFLGRSVSWVDKYKQKAKVLKLITVKHEYVNTGIKWPDRLKYMNRHKIPQGRAKKYKGTLYIIDADILTSTIYVTKRKKCTKANEVKATVH